LSKKQNKNQSFKIKSLQNKIITLFICNCGDENGFVLLVFICDDGVPVVVGDVKVFDINKPRSWLFPIVLLLLFAFAFAFEVDVILQTDTAFLRYFLSRRVVPFVIPTSKHRLKRHAWQLLRRCLSIVQVFVAGHIYSFVPWILRLKNALHPERKFFFWF
jgi:hypothetical protein